MAARIIAATPAKLAQLFDRKMGRIVLLLSLFIWTLNIPAGRPALPTHWLSLEE
jgi:transcriptional regulator of aromatic amino acid metabolism